MQYGRESRRNVFRVASAFIQGEASSFVAMWGVPPFGYCLRIGVCLRDVQALSRAYGTTYGSVMERETDQ